LFETEDVALIKTTITTTDDTLSSNT